MLSQSWKKSEPQSKENHLGCQSDSKLISTLGHLDYQEIDGRFRIIEFPIDLSSENVKPSLKLSTADIKTCGYLTLKKKRIPRENEINRTIWISLKQWYSDQRERERVFLNRISFSKYICCLLITKRIISVATE